VHGLHRHLAPGVVVGLTGDVLDLDVDGGTTGQQGERRVQGRYPCSATVRGADPETFDLGERHRPYEPGAFGRAVDIRIVHHHGVPIRRHAHVELDCPGADLDRLLERGQRVLGLLGGGATVRHDQGQHDLTEWPFRHYRPPHVAGSVSFAGRNAG